MDVMITVGYCLKIPREAFFSSENGYEKEEMREQLEKSFPKEIALTENAVAQREYLIYHPLVENKNCLRCVSCGKWLYMPGKEHLSVLLDHCKMVKGIPLCSSCAWELEADMENEGFDEKLREQFSVTG